jgi:ELWxxDGT repeat protein
MVFHDKLFFGVEHGIHGRDLWEYNGTDSAIRVNDIYPNENFTQPGDFHIFHNTLYFSAKDSTHGMELWKYDDVNQPAMVVDINSGPESSDPNRLVNFNNKLYFSADDGIHGQELWMLSDNQTINKVKRQSNIPITIFPNPTTGQFTISFGSSPIQKALIELCDLQGKQLLSKTFHKATTATIDLTGLPKTMYLVRLSLNGEIIEKKISLQ